MHFIFLQLLKKKQLLNQWNSSVFALQKREEIIKKLNNEIK